MSKNRKRLWISLICLLLFATGGVVYAASSGLFSDSGKELGPEDGEEYVKAIESRKAAITGVTVPQIETSPYEKYADDPRIVKGPRTGGLGSWYIKQILILENKIPADAPCLTKEKAVEICNGLTDLPTQEGEWQNAVMAAFDEVALAPDFKGGSGMTRIIYFTDETHSKEIMIAGFRVYYKDYDLPNASLEILYNPFGES